MFNDSTNASSPATFGILEVFQDGSSRFRSPIDRAFIIGRQRTGDPEPIAKARQEAGDRLIIASRSDANVSREHLRIEPSGDGGFQIINTSRNCTVGIDASRELLPGKTCFVDGFTRLHVHDWVITIDALDWKGRFVSMGTPEHGLGSNDGSLATHPGELNQTVFGASLVATLGSSFDSQQRAYLMRWLKVIADLFRHAGDRGKFLDQAKLSIRQILGADDLVAYSGPNSGSDPTRSASDFVIHPDVIDHVREFGQTILYRVDASDQAPGRQIMATPLFDRDGNINGILAASRTADQNGVDPLPSYGELEKSLLELIATGFGDV